jgi:hypothetical protein
MIAWWPARDRGTIPLASVLTIIRTRAGSSRPLTTRDDLGTYGLAHDVVRFALDGLGRLMYSAVGASAILFDDRRLQWLAATI